MAPAVESSTLGIVGRLSLVVSVFVVSVVRVSLVCSLRISSIDRWSYNNNITVNRIITNNGNIKIYRNYNFTTNSDDSYVIIK